MQPLLAQHKAEQKAEQERQAKMTPTVADLQAEIACLRQQVASLQKDNTCLRNKLRDLRVSKTFDNFDFSADTKDAKLSLVADEKPENL